MIVRFTVARPIDDPRRFEAGGDLEIDVTYGLQSDAPAEGDYIEPDGSDERFPEGVYEVTRRRWQFDQGGCRGDPLSTGAAGMITAGSSGVCSCGARIREGDSIGLVDGEWCCEDCVTDMGEDGDADVN